MAPMTANAPRVSAMIAASAPPATPPPGVHAAEHRGGGDRGARGDLDGQAVRRVLGDATHPAGPGEHLRPGGRDITAERRGRAKPGDDDDAVLIGLGHGNLLPLMVTWEGQTP